MNLGRKFDFLKMLFIGSKELRDNTMIHQGIATRLHHYNKTFVQEVCLIYLKSKIAGKKIVKINNLSNKSISIKSFKFHLRALKIQSDQ